MIKYQARTKCGSTISSQSRAGIIWSLRYVHCSIFRNIQRSRMTSILWSDQHLPLAVHMSHLHSHSSKSSRAPVKRKQIESLILKFWFGTKVFLYRKMYFFPIKSFNWHKLKIGVYSFIFIYILLTLTLNNGKLVLLPWFSRSEGEFTHLICEVHSCFSRELHPLCYCSGALCSHMKSTNACINVSLNQLGLIIVFFLSYGLTFTIDSPNLKASSVQIQSEKKTEEITCTYRIHLNIKLSSQPVWCRIERENCLSMTNA